MEGFAMAPVAIFKEIFDQVLWKDLDCELFCLDTKNVHYIIFISY